MDPIRTDLLAAAHSLSRLQITLRSQLAAARREGNIVQREPHWTIADLRPPSPWFDTADQGVALSGAAARVALVIQELLSMIRSNDPIDARRACAVLQFVGSGSAWSARVVAFAGRHSVELDAPPRDFRGLVKVYQELRQTENDLRAQV